MESLEAKTNKVRASFEALSNNLLDSDIVGLFLDLVNSALKLADTDIGRFVTQVTLLTGVGFGLQQVNKGLKIIPTIVGQFKTVFGAFNAAKQAGGIKTLAGGFGLLKTAAAAPLPHIVALSTALAILLKLAPKIKQFFEEQTMSLSEATEKQGEYKTQLEENQKKLQDLEKTPWGDRTAEINNEIDRIKEENQVLQENIDKYDKIRERKAKQTTTKEVSVGTGKKKYTSTFLGMSWNSLEKAEKAIKGIYGETSKYADFLIDKLKVSEEQTKTSGESLKNYLIKELDNYNQKLLENGKLTDEEKAGFDAVMQAAQEQSEAYAVLGEDVSDLNTIMQTASDLFDVYAHGVILSQNQIELLTAKYPAFSQAITNTNGVLSVNFEKIGFVAKQSGVTEQAIYDLIAAEIAANSQRLDLTQQIEALRNLATQAGIAAESITAVFSINPEAAKMQTAAWARNMMAAEGISWEKAIQKAQQKYINELWGKFEKEPVVQVDPVVTKTGMSTSSTKKEKTEVEKLNEALEKTLKLYEDRAWFLEQELPEDPSISDEAMEKYKNIQGQRVEIFKQAQDEILKSIEQLKTIGLDENDETIRELKKKWWGFENEIKDISSSIAKAQEDAAKRAEEAWRDALENKIAKYQKKQNAYETLFSAMVDKIDEEIKKLNDKRADIEEYWNDKIAKVQEANDRLEEQIQLEQYLNNLAQAKDQQLLTFTGGQFQYVGDMDAVGKAQAELDAYNRELALQEEIRNMEEARDKALEIIDSQIKNWEKYKEEWGSVVENYQKKQDELIVLEELGIELEGELWKERLENLDSYVSQYEDLMDRLNRAQNQLNAGYGGGSSGGSGGRGDRDDSGGGWTEAEMNEGFTKPSGSSGKKPGGSAINKPFGGSSGVTGGSKPLKKHAKGTLSAPSGLSWVGEEGPEIRMVNSGDTIFPNEASRNLWDWSKINPNNAMGGTNISVGNVTLPSVTNAREFVGELKNMAYQRAYKRA